MLTTGANTASTPMAEASAAVTAAILDTSETFHDMPCPIGSGNIVPPGAPPCSPSLPHFQRNVRYVVEKQDWNQNSSDTVYCPIHGV